MSLSDAEGFRNVSICDPPEGQLCDLLLGECPVGFQGYNDRFFNDLDQFWAANHFQHSLAVPNVLDYFRLLPLILPKWGGCHEQDHAARELRGRQLQ